MCARKNLANTNTKVQAIWAYRPVVRTWDFESQNPSSTLGKPKGGCPSPVKETGLRSVGASLRGSNPLPPIFYGLAKLTPLQIAHPRLSRGYDMWNVSAKLTPLQIAQLVERGIVAKKVAASQFSPSHWFDSGSGDMVF